MISIGSFDRHARRAGQILTKVRALCPMKRKHNMRA